MSLIFMPFSKVIKVYSLVEKSRHSRKFSIFRNWHTYIQNHARNLKFNLGKRNFGFTNNSDNSNIYSSKKALLEKEKTVIYSSNIVNHGMNPRLTCFKLNDIKC